MMVTFVLCILDPPSSSLPIFGDGNCFFRTLSVLISGVQDHHAHIRFVLCKYISENKTVFHSITNNSNYIVSSNMAKCGVWATEVEIFAAASLLATNVYTFSPYQMLNNTPVYKWLLHAPLPGAPSVFTFSQESVYILNVHDHFQPVLSV